LRSSSLRMCRAPLRRRVGHPRLDLPSTPLGRHRPSCSTAVTSLGWSNYGAEQLRTASYGDTLRGFNDNHAWLVAEWARPAAVGLRPQDGRPARQPRRSSPARWRLLAGLAPPSPVPGKAPAMPSWRLANEPVPIPAGLSPGSDEPRPLMRSHRAPRGSWSGPAERRPALTRSVRSAPAYPDERKPQLMSPTSCAARKVVAAQKRCSAGL
jgi:hypothetical protein